jgi:hypothetical protein
VHFTDVHLFTGGHVIGMYFTAVHLVGVHFTGVHLTGVHLQAFISYKYASLTTIYLVGVHVSAGTALIQPIALAWLLPTPTMAISEMPTQDS